MPFDYKAKGWELAGAVADYAQALLLKVAQSQCLESREAGSDAQIYFLSHFDGVGQPLIRPLQVQSRIFEVFSGQRRELGSVDINLWL